MKVISSAATIQTALCVLALSTWTADAATHYVWQDSPNPTAPYNSWETAAHVIQGAVDAAANGDTVLVTNGVYGAGGTDSSRVSVDKPLSLLSVNGPDVTMIIGAQSSGGGFGAGAIRCVYLTNGASLAGFTLTNGWASGNGGGVQCDSTDAVLTNCVITGNSAYRNGGGVSGGTLNDCVLIGNSAGFYDGLFVGTRPRLGGGGAHGSTLNNCRLERNSAPHYEGGAALQSTLNNCLVRSNSAPRGGGTYEGALNNCTLRHNLATSAGGGAYGSTLRNCVLTKNSASAGGGAYASSLDNCTLTRNAANTGGGSYGGALNNCIIYFNTASRGPNYSGGTLNHSCANPLPGSGIGNISVDPLMAGTTHISVGSPCRGAGNPAYVTGTDIDGEAWADPPSMGCDEFYAETAAGPLSVAIVTTVTNVATGYPVGLTALVEGQPEDCVWDFGDGLIASNRLETTHAWMVSGDFWVILTAYNVDNPGGVSATVTVHVVTQPVHYVAVNSANPVPPYSSWGTAATNIQDAVDAAGGLPGALVLVTNGIYATGGRAVESGTLTNRVAVEGPLIVRSVNGPGATIIEGWRVSGTANGGSAVRCAYLAAGSSLSGFTLTNGATPESLGGGVRCESSSAVLSNCVVTGNEAHGGGGVYGGTLYDCMLTGNEAHDSGGGVYGGTLYDCVLTGNEAHDSGGAACGSTLINCVLTGNSADSNGGGAVGSTLTGCTLTDNMARYGYGGGSASSTLNYCRLSGNRAVRGGGAFTGTLNNSFLTGNSATEYGGGAYGYESSSAWGTTSRRCILNNCALTGNTARYGGGAAGRQYSSDCVLNNCTLTGNSAANSGGGVYRANLNNSIAYFNTAPSGPNYDPYSRFNYSCTTPLPFPSRVETWNIAADPLLVSPSHLSAHSPCRGAGSDVYATGTDIDGEVWGNPPSIGCDEYPLRPLAGLLKVGVQATHTYVPLDYTVEFTASVEGQASSIVWDFGDRVTATNQPYTSRAWCEVGDYQVVLTAFNDSHPGGVSATAMVQVVTQPVHYVSVDGTNPVPPYTSWATAARTIQEAVDAAVAGSEVLVTNGVYSTGRGAVSPGMPASRVVVDKPLAVSSINGPESTMIVGSKEESVLCVYLGDGSRLSGFTLAKGAGGVHCESTNAWVSNCVITDNSGSGASGGTLSNCALTGNSASSGGGAYSATLNNCTLTGNSAVRGGGAYDSILNNCIVYFNTATIGPNYHSSCTLNNCWTTPMPYRGLGNLSGDPQMASADHLSAGSWCIGAGNPAYATQTDIDGEAWANPPSIGCDEYYAGGVAGAMQVSITLDHTNVAVGYPAKLTARIQGRPSASTWDLGDGLVVSNKPYASHSWSEPGDHQVVLTAYNTDFPEGISATATVHVAQPPVHYVAVNSARPMAPYTSWRTAAQTIQDAVDAAGTLPGTLVLVTNGTYNVGERDGVRVVVDKLLTVRSVNGPETTVIRGNHYKPNIRGVFLADGATLSGFTVTGGGGGVRCGSASAVITNCIIRDNPNSGGVYRGTLINCVLSNNRANDGGGASQSTLYNCTLKDNLASRGGGAISSTLYNCTLTGNSGNGGGVFESELHDCVLSANSARFGGGASVSILNNCTLIGNSAWEAGGGAYWSTLYNCVLTGNSGGGAASCTLNNCTIVANSGGGVWDSTTAAPPCAVTNCILYYNTPWNYDDTTTIEYSCTTPLPEGIGNISDQPLLMDADNWSDLRLQSNSPCINAGNNDYVTRKIDLDGMPRIIGGTVDIGAYEFLVPGGFPPVVLSQPVDLRVNSGDMAEFSVVAESPLPMDYQWLFNGGPIQGEANSTLLLPSVQPGQAGGYAVTVSNLLGFVTSSNAWLTINRFPTADASATPPLIVSGNSVDALAVLDGSRSSDPDGDLLNCRWFSASTPIATGMVVAAVLPAGTHTIDLAVDDGLAQDTNTVTVTVLTAEQAVERLIVLVNESDVQHRRPLLASLEAALASIERDNCHSAVGQLGAFQSKVAAQVSDTALATDLIAGAGQVIAALEGDGSSQVAGKIHSLKRHRNGKMQMKMSGPAGKVYIVEASTNLVDWEAVVVATVNEDGSFEFEDPDAAKHQSRFYRIITP